MKAIVQDRYGSPADVLELREVDRPAVGEDEVLVRVHAASLHPDVWHVVEGLPYVLRIMGAGILKPKNRIPGTDVAGTVAEVGGKVSRFRPGDEVFGESVRGHQWHNGGAFAELVAIPEDALAPKPAKLSFEQAAAVPTSALIALQGVRDQGAVQPGQKVLVNGAGGGVGVFAVQLAKAYGAEATGVDATEKQDLLRSIGADHTIDYTEEDFTLGEERYDLIVDIPGNRPFEEVRRVLTPEGTYVLIGHDRFGESGGRFLGGTLGHLFSLQLRSAFVSQRVNPGGPNKTEDRLAVLRELIEAGEVTPVVDRTFPLSETAEAIRYLREGNPRGKIVITV